MIISKKPKMNDFLAATVTRRQKPSVHDSGLLLIQTFGAKGSYFTNNRNSDYIYVYHAEKIRPKFKRIVTGKRKKKIEVNKLREGTWTMRIFKFQKDRVKKVEQHNRYFTIELK